MASKEEVVKFLGNSFPIVIKTIFCCEDLSRQYETVSEPLAKSFEDLLRGQEDKFLFIMNGSDQECKKGIYYHHIWGGATFINVTIYDTCTFDHFIEIFLKFCSEEGNLEMQGDLLRLILPLPASEK